MHFLSVELPCVVIQGHSFSGIQRSGPFSQTKVVRQIFYESGAKVKMVGPYGD